MTVDVDGAEQTASGVGSIQQLSIAPNGQFVAAYTADGRLKVWTSDFSKALSEFATQSEKMPEQLEWCGTDSVVMCWQVGMLLLLLLIFCCSRGDAPNARTPEQSCIPQAQGTANVMGQ